MCNKKLIILGLIIFGVVTTFSLYFIYTNQIQFTITPTVIPTLTSTPTEAPEFLIVKVYFNNSKMNEEFSCNKVVPLNREIPKTQGVARAALEELFKGPTEKEKEQGFFTSIPSGIVIQSLSIENGVAKADFNEQLEFQVGGSCRVAAIRAQITETLKQFSTVNSVIISIDGRTEDILQP